MAFLSRTPNSSSSPHFQSTKRIKLFVNSKPVITTTVSCASKSPFTEKHAAERYHRDSWVYKGRNQPAPPPSSSCPLISDRESVRDYDIALQLPELKRLLEVLRGKRGNEGGGGPHERGPGNVFLVGTGPGDPELLTLKALRVIESADLLLYDRLVSNDVLDLVGPNARLLYVGKTAGYHSRTQVLCLWVWFNKTGLNDELSLAVKWRFQWIEMMHLLEEIHELLLSFAEVGASVVRLKGGDPLVFGRGGEEMDFLQQQGIEVKVIPGITAASGIAAELGIPLTHRGIANSVRFLTGHSRKGGADPLFVGEHAADPDSTLVVYMGLSTFPSLSSKLMCHGLPDDTPAAAIERGTTPQQRVVFSELKDLADEIASNELVSPTLIIIGKVVALSPLWPHPTKETYTLVEKSR
ncbi:siroheme synthase [Striga asiatica]|uniref:uroporphyrinogen-III C-methyltransferase n=1 Tax=Striga asiatica TaxID=4170 RepID=A0A5A7RJT7_STRAF|nr:siroheme synthase [Striga asiatica]